MYVYIYIHIYTYYTHPTSSMKSRTLPAHVLTLKKRRLFWWQGVHQQVMRWFLHKGAFFHKHPEILKSKNSWGKKRLLLGKKGKLLSAPFSVHPEFISVHQPGSGSGVESFDFSLLFSIFTNNGKTWGKKNNITLKCNSNDYLNLRWTIIGDDHHIDARCPEDDEQMQML